VRHSELDQSELGDSVLFRQLRRFENAVRVRLTQHEVILDLPRDRPEQSDEQRCEVVDQRLAETLDVYAAPDPWLAKLLPKFIHHGALLSVQVGAALCSPSRGPASSFVICCSEPATCRARPSG